MPVHDAVFVSSGGTIWRDLSTSHAAEPPMGPEGVVRARRSWVHRAASFIGEVDTSCDENARRKAAKRGHIDALACLRELGAPWDASACSAAASEGPYQRAEMAPQERLSREPICAGTRGEEGEHGDAEAGQRARHTLE